MGQILKQIVSFSKLITIAWVAVWIETILFSQIATIFNFGDAASLSYINNNVITIGEIICSFYFGTKCIENVAKGVENYMLTKDDSIMTEEVTTNNDGGPGEDYQGE